MRSHIRIIILIIIAVQYRYVVYGDKMDIPGLVKFAKPMRTTCIRKTGVDVELVDNVRSKGEFPKDRKLMCFFRCVSVMLKIMNKEFVMTLSAVQQQIDMLVQEEPGKRLMEVTTQCFNSLTQTDDSCLFAYEFTRCMYETDKMVYIVP